MNATFMGVSSRGLDANQRQYNLDNPNSQKNFKEFLREKYAISINQKSIEAAPNRLDEIPEGTKELLLNILSQRDDAEWGNLIRIQGLREE